MSRRTFFLAGFLISAIIYPAIAIPAESTAKESAKTSAAKSSDTSAPTGPKHDLRYRFAKGETVRSKVVQQSKIETTISGTSQTADMTSISTRAWRVTDVSQEGNMTFETSIESIDMRHKMSGRQEVKYNSQTDEKPPLGYESAAESVGKVLTQIVIDPAGKILKREKKNQASVDNVNVQVVMPLPGDPIAVGESWSAPFDITITLEDQQTKVITARNRYQLDKVENGVATISVETVLPPVNDPKIRAQLIQRLTRGTARFDLKAGRVLSQKTELDEQVIGFHGADSSLHYLGRFTEELLAADSKTAAKPAGSKK
jgi:hypothetical protein